MFLHCPRVVFKCSQQLSITQGLTVWSRTLTRFRQVGQTETRSRHSQSQSGFGISVFGNDHVFEREPTNTRPCCLIPTRASSSFPKGADCIILMGSPGSGKTSVGRLVGNMLNKPVVDVDNDFLEQYWDMTIAKKLSQVGSDKFVEEEGKAVMHLNPPEGAVISLTGSVPMYKPAIRRLRNLGIVIFLDVQHEDILDRLERMKVNRIVGQENGVPMLDILKYRQQFYEENYDLRIICEALEPLELVAQKVVRAVKSCGEYTGYVSTRGQGRKTGSKTFSDVVLEGLAADGGLYVPAELDFPRYSQGEWTRLVQLTYPERALRVLEKWIHPTDMHPSMLSSYLNATYTLDHFNCSKMFPVHHLQDNQYVLELFHGPTASFKDAALQLLPKFFKHARDKCSPQSDLRYLILVATSGDTGGAVLYGFSDQTVQTNTDVMVLFPEDGVSDIQKAQMTSVDNPSVNVVGVKSDFDYCQSAIKSIFNNVNLQQELLEKHMVKISAANSINWGRLLPQVVYHCSSYLDLVQQNVVKFGDPVDLCVPTGNFGNILAAFYAKKMGIPYKRLIIASNENNVLTQFLHTGRYELTDRRLILTPSPAIDILKSSNLERFLYHITGRDAQLVADWYTQLEENGTFQVSKETHAELQEIITADWCCEEESMECIQRTFQQTGYLLDPHTAVAKVVADRLSNPQRPLLIASTAHYAKFGDSVLKAICQESPHLSLAELFQRLESLENLNSPNMHEELKDGVLRRRVHNTVCPPSIEDIVSEVRKFASRASASD